MAAGIGAGRFGLTLRLAAPGVPSMAVALSRFQGQVVDFQPYWETSFKPIWRDWITQAFRTQGASTGAPWAPWSPRYAAWRQKHGAGGQGILVLHGSLSASLINPDRDAFGVWRASRTSLEVGTRRPWAIVHQTGSRNGRIPARPPIRPTPELMTQLGKELQRFVVTSWSAARQQSSSYSGA